jgi:branched-chain amino acid transport system substrate-binding protein
MVKRPDGENICQPQLSFQLFLRQCSTGDKRQRYSRTLSAGAGFMGHFLLSVAILLFSLIGTTAPSSAQIKIGVGGPMTGPNAAFGRQLLNGVQAAAADINIRGGILGQSIEVVTGDDRSDPREGVAVANRFASEGVRFVIGHFSSGVSIPASEVYSEKNILMITPSSTNPRLTERRLWNVFRTSGRDDQQGGIAAGWIASRFAGKRVAIIGDQTVYGQLLVDSTRSNLNKIGIREVFVDKINVGEKDFSALVRKILNERIDVYFWGGLHTEGALIARQLKDAGSRAVMISGDGITSDEFATIGGAAVLGTLMTFPPDPRRNPAARNVVADFNAKKINPEAYTLYAYAAVQAIQQAANIARSLEPRLVSTAMKSGVRFQTVLGPFGFDQKGDSTRTDYVVYEWQRVNGRIEYVELPSSTTSSPPAVAALPPAPSPPPTITQLPTRRLALVVGNDRYNAIAPLERAGADAELIGQTLRGIGFDVTVARDTDRAAFSRVFNSFRARLQPGDTVIFFFAGHGVEINGANFLLPTDMPQEARANEGLLRDAAFSSAELIRRLREPRPRTILVVLDACRDNPLATPGGRSIGGTRGLGREPDNEGVMVLMSAAQGQVALDRLPRGDTDRNSVFTRVFAPLLREPGLGLREIANRTRQRVTQLARQHGHEQRPTLQDDTLDDIVLTQR